MNKLFSILLALAGMPTLAGGGLGLANNPTVSVYQHIGGIGDYLIAPLYLADTGWSSELRIVNTSMIYSTVAKVVVHERANAREAMHFMIFLSPGDTWNGTLQCLNAPTGNCSKLGLTSQDTDSMPQYLPNAQGSISITGSDPAEIGYIDVIESGAWSLGAAPVNKKNVVAQHNADLQAAGTSGFSILAATGAAPFAATPQTGATPFGFTGYAETRSAGIAATENILAGTLRLTHALNNASATLPLVAIANYKNARPLSDSVYTGVGTDEPANASPSYTTLGALESALNANDWMVPYDYKAGSILTSITFPTRQTFDGLVHGENTTGSPGIYAFNNKAGSPVYAELTARDQQENAVSSRDTAPYPPYRPAFATVGFSIVDLGNTTRDSTGYMNIMGTSTFQRGWLNINLDPQKGSKAAYPGAPAIVTAMQWSFFGNSLRAEWWYPQFKNMTGANSND